MKKQNIWLLLDSRKAGGIESHVQQLAEGLFHHGVTLEVIFLTDYGRHPMRDALLKQGIGSRTLNGKFSTLYQMLRDEQPSVLHTHGYKAGVLGRLAAYLTKTPRISTYHAGEISHGRLAFYDQIDRLSAGFANHVFAVSPQIAKRLPGKVDVFNNFVNTKNVQPSKGKQIAFVGRVSTEKGPDYFMALAFHFPTLKFHLYGDGPLLSELKKKAPTNLYLHGQQDDMSSIWPKIGLLVMPSRYEGLPMAALEAMARGIPVLAFRVGALDRLIASGVNGWLIKPESFDQLNKHITLWHNLNEQQKSTLQLACQNTIGTQFSSEIAIPKLMLNYQHVSS